jgi:hypothetical protein
MTLLVNPRLLRELHQGHGELLESLTASDQAIQSNPVGSWLLDVVQSVANMPLLIESNAQINFDNPPTVNGALLAGGIAQIFLLGYPAVQIIEGLISQTSRRHREQRGEEPLPAKSRPELVIVGPVEFGDMLLSGQRPRQARNIGAPIVMAHPDEGVPMAYTDMKADFHYRIPLSGDRLLNPNTLRNIGIHRARNVVLAGFNTYRAIFYGDQSGGPISPSTCSTYLNTLSVTQSPGTEHVVVVIPKDASILQATNFRDLLGNEQPMIKRLKEKGVRVDIIHPEDALLNLLSARVAEIVEQRSITASPSKVRLCLIGNSNDRALKNFKSAVESLHPNFEMSIISDTSIGDIDANSAATLGKTERRQHILGLLRASDLNLVYGENDEETTDIANAVCQDLCSLEDLSAGERQQTICVVETERGSRDAAAMGLKTLCIYAELRRMIHDALATSPAK